MIMLPVAYHLDWRPSPLFFIVFAFVDQIIHIAQNHRYVLAHVVKHCVAAERQIFESEEDTWEKSKLP